MTRGNRSSVQMSGVQPSRWLIEGAVTSEKRRQISKLKI